MKISKKELSLLKELNCSCIEIAGKICQVIKEKEKDLYVEAAPFNQLYKYDEKLKVFSHDGNLKVWSHDGNNGHCRCDVFLTLDAHDGLLASITWNSTKAGVASSKSELRRVFNGDFYDLACTIVGGC